MRLLVAFWGHEGSAVTRVAMLCMAAAICESLGLLSAISAVLSSHSPFLVRIGLVGLALMFTAAFLTACYIAFGRGLRLGEAACDRLLLRMAAHIRNAELRDIENLGADTVLNGIARDTSSLLEASWIALACLFTVCTLIVPVAYIVTLSFSSFLLLVAVGVAAVPILRALHVLQVSREHAAAVADFRFLRLANQVITGFTWFKLDRRRQEDLRAHYLRPSLDAARRSSVQAGRAFAANLAVIDLLVMGGIGAIAYIVPFDGARETGITVLALLLSTWGGINEMFTLFPALIGAGGALERLQALEHKLAATERPPLQQPLTGFRHIAYRGICYEYRDDLGTLLFRFGPVDLEINKGEIVFIVGGNGSGKSTLSKLITGLYLPLDGIVEVDGRNVAPSRLRGLFGGVLSDYHLFEKCYGLADIDDDAAARLLTELGVGRVTTLRDGRFSTRDLSTGQRKRLALVLAVLANRPILIYDEWAADQDPEFRDLFYKRILPEQRTRGTTVIAITHDDRYFDCADRVIRLESGVIVDVSAEPVTV
jgi:putative ATP-binding cassette transporter